MASDMEAPMAHQQQQAEAVMSLNHIASPMRQPSTPQDLGSQDLSQVTLPSTEIPQSPIDPNESFKTEINDDRPAITVIPSSLTPPPSSQINNHNQNGRAKRAFSSSQQSTLFSPPATILTALRERRLSSDFVPPAPQQVLEASPEELRTMLQSCIADNHKLKMETAHHKLQYNLLSIQADEDQKRATVEHDMIRREVDALRTAEHSRQAKRELSDSSESTQAKYLQMKMCYEEALKEMEGLRHRIKAAKKVIQQKADETVGLTEQRDVLLNRIRENREHLQSMCSPGGIFHSALSPKPQRQVLSTPQPYRSTPRQTPRSAARQNREDEHGISALLQAASQDNSAPSTPIPSHRPAPRQMGRHHRNAQSMSSLQVTPMNRRGEHSGLLPSVDLVPQTEPQRSFQGQYVPTTPVAKSDRRRQSRESTISVEDTEELARQALEASLAHSGRRTRDDDDEEVFDSQASQAATEMLRRDPQQSFDVASSAGSRRETHSPVEESGRVHARLISSFKGDGDKRKFSGNHETSDEIRRDQGSPAKKMRVGGALIGDRRKSVGLGIQYSQ